MKTRLILLLCGMITGISVTEIQAQDQWMVGLSGGYAQPVATISDRFGGTVNGQAELLYRYSDRVDIEAAVGYFKYEENDYSFTSPRTDIRALTDQMDLDFENIVFSISARYHLGAASAGMRPYVVGGTAIHRWVTHRGTYTVDFLDETGAVTSSITANPFSQADYNLGVLGGIGVLLNQSESMQFKLEARYHFTLGEIYASQAAGLDKVNPIQHLWLNVGIQFAF